MTLEIGEPEEHVLDPPLLDLLPHVLARTGVRRRPVLALDLRHGSSSLDGWEATLAAWSRSISAASPASCRAGGASWSPCGSRSSPPAAGSRSTRATISPAAGGRCRAARR